jgi:putative transposase
LTTDSNHSEPSSENLLNRDFNPNQQNQVWTTDISYVWTGKGWVSLAVVIDLFSRRVVGWHADESMKTALVSRVLMMAINLRAPSPGLLHHSDRGSQYASKQYRKLLQNSGSINSMSRKGNCWDNSPTERFFSSLKRESITWVDYHDKAAAVRYIKDYIACYNGEMLHTTINDMTPIQFEICA